MDLLQSMENQLSPEVVAKLGIEITSDDIARILGVSGVHGHQFNLEDKKKGAFQGDMVPENSKQLKKFVAQAESQRTQRKAHGSFGAGRPWSGGKVSFCFHETATKRVREAVWLAIGQFKKSVPCLQFRDVGYASGKSCQESPAVIISSHDTGCWSYVGQLRSRSAQELNLQSPGCDSVGTALHEMGHALGMAHEQARPDRDKYVEIHEERIRSGKAHNFDIAPEGWALENHRDQRALTVAGDTERPYDLLSIMHYDADSFSTSDKPTITAKDKAYELYTHNKSHWEIALGNRHGELPHAHFLLFLL